MSKKSELQKVSEETMRFMRGKYSLDEVAYENCVKFRQGKKTILSIDIHEGTSLWSLRSLYKKYD